MTAILNSTIVNNWTKLETVTFIDKLLLKNQTLHVSLLGFKAFILQSILTLIKRCI